MDDIIDLRARRELRKLQLVILPCSGPIENRAIDFYNCSYNFWHDTWSKTLRKLVNQEKLYSNDYTRHNFSCSIFKDTKAISYVSFSIFDLRLATRRNDSIFSSWPTKVLEALSRNGQFVIMPAWFTVSPQYRKSRNNYPINLATTMTELFGKLIIHLSCSLGLATARVNRGVDNALSKIGGSKVGESKAFNCKVELMCFSPEDVQKKTSEHSFTTKYLWKNKQVYWREFNDYRKKLPRAS